MNKISRFGSFFIILLSACGNFSVTLPADTPIPTPPTEITTPAETATPTVTEAPSLTETPTPTERPQAEPGTMILDPEYNLDGRVAINSENSAAFYSYLTDAFWRINKDYFANLGVANSTDAQKYMKNNILPAGFRYPTAKGTGGIQNYDSPFLWNPAL